MAAAGRLTLRNPAALPRLGEAPSGGPFLLDANVMLNVLAGRADRTLQALLNELPQHFVSAPTVAELSWTLDRLEPAHPATAQVVGAIERVLNRLDPRKILAPSADQWRLAGERAGVAVRALAGPQRAFRAAAERHEMLNDALTAAVAAEAGLEVVTADRDFDILQQLDPSLKVLFYN